MKPVCMVIGAGAGIGGNVGMRFARDGYHAVLCRRTDKQGLDRIVKDIEDSGGSASGFLLNAVKPDKGGCDKAVPISPEMVELGLGSNGHAVSLLS